MKRRLFPAGLVFLCFVGVWLAITYHSPSSSLPLKQTNPVSLRPSPPPLPSGKQTYTIENGQKDLKIQITKAIIDPLDVKPGQQQNMSLNIKSQTEIDSVTAEIDTDTGKKTQALNLTSKNAGEEQWSGSWMVRDTHSTTYHTTFTAKDKNGNSQVITLDWNDACAPPPGGNWTLDGNCSISGTNGVDNGNLTLNNANYTLTLQTGSTFAFNPGSSINLSAGSIAIASGAQIKKTYLWMQDSDGDGYPDTLTENAADTSPGAGYRRRNALATISSVDCNNNDATKWQNLIGYPDADGDGYYSTLPATVCTGATLPAGYNASVGNDCYDSGTNAASVHPGQTGWFTSPRGDGSWDYNCDGSTSYEYPANTYSTSVIGNNNACGCSQSGTNGVMNYNCGTTSNYTGCWEGNGQGGSNWCNQGNGGWCDTTMGHSNCSSCTNVCADYGGPIGVYYVGSVTQGCH